MKLFDKKPKPPLAQAQLHLNDAIAVVYAYLPDEAHHTTPEELYALDQLAQAFWVNYATTTHIMRRLRARMEERKTAAS